MSVSPRKHGNPVSSINATNETNVSVYGLLKRKKVYKKLDKFEKIVIKKNLKIWLENNLYEKFEPIVLKTTVEHNKA